MKQLTIKDAASFIKQSLNKEFSEAHFSLKSEAKYNAIKISSSGKINKRELIKFVTKFENFNDGSIKFEIDYVIVM